MYLESFRIQNSRGGFPWHTKQVGGVCENRGEICLNLPYHLKKHGEANTVKEISDFRSPVSLRKFEFTWQNHLCPFCASPQNIWRGRRVLTCPKALWSSPFRFIYSDDDSGLNMKNVMQTLYAAKKYLLDDLISACRVFVQDNLRPIHAVEIFRQVRGYW